DGPRDDYPSGSRVYRDARAWHYARSGPDDRPDGVRVHGVPARVCGVRDSHRVVGGPARHARSALADCDLVVVLHGGDGRRVQLPDPPDRTFPLRRRRGGRVAVRGADVLAMDSRTRARHGPGELLRRRAPGRWTDAGAGAVDAHVPLVAPDLPLLRRARLHLGGNLARVVPRRSLAAPLP